MRITSRLLLATGLTTFFLVASAGAQTPPQPAPPTPTPTEQQPPTPVTPAEPAPTQPSPTPQPQPAQPTQETPPVQTPPPQEPTRAAAPRRAARWMVSGNVGYQLINQEFTTNSVFEAYEEQATLTSAGELTSGPIFDGSVTYSVTPTVGVSAGLSFYSTDSDVAVVARVPHPVFHDQIRVATYEATGVQHSSMALNLNAVWMVPFTRAVDFAVSVGPSIVFVTQDVVSSANLQPENPPYTEPRIDAVTVTEQQKTTIGFNAGADMIYSFNPRYGIGVTARYLFASADIEGLTDSVQVGGFQILGGIRIKF